MDIILVRHGAREDNGLSLTIRGRHQIFGLAEAMQRRGTIPDRYFSSAHPHAVESAELLAAQVFPEVGVSEMKELTPKRGPGRFDRIVRLTTGFDESQCIVLVGHEGRLSDLVVELTGSRARQIPHGGAVCVHGESLQALLCGRGSILFRYPTVDHQEEQLGSKVNSKMTVATFLAGFVFTALSALLLLQGADWTWHRVVAAAALTAALVLFVSAVYIYDQLSTPPGFWTDGNKSRYFWRKLYDAEEKRLEKRWRKAFDAAAGNDNPAEFADDDKTTARLNHDGPMYWSMVKTSRLVFTPAVVFSLIGFLTLLSGTEDSRILTGGSVALVLAAIYAAFFRPNLGAD